jgi:hypothetical protein
MKELNLNEWETLGADFILTGCYIVLGNTKVNGIDCLIITDKLYPNEEIFIIEA